MRKPGIKGNQEKDFIRKAGKQEIYLRFRCLSTYPDPAKDVEGNGSLADHLS